MRRDAKGEITEMQLDPSAIERFGTHLRSRVAMTQAEFLTAVRFADDGTASRGPGARLLAGRLG